MEQCDNIMPRQIWQIYQMRSPQKTRVSPRAALSAKISEGAKNFRNKSPQGKNRRMREFEQSAFAQRIFP
ncbi:MAG: hypothetical protein DBX55_06855 [Verrucomicrobia bacterium]|nr:MAG: hypothetical protein DBX55_06855 [Verrucomicrobiota bacterium]